MFRTGRCDHVSAPEPERTTAQLNCDGRGNILIWKLALTCTPDPIRPMMRECGIRLSVFTEDFQKLPKGTKGYQKLGLGLGGLKFGVTVACTQASVV